MLGEPRGWANGARETKRSPSPAFGILPPLMENFVEEKRKKKSAGLTPHIHNVNVTHLCPLLTLQSIRFCEMLTFRVTQCVTVTFKHAVENLEALPGKAYIMTRKAHSTEQ